MGRATFVVPPLTGHVNPTVPVALALERRGHEVAWIAHPTKVRPLLPAGARILPLDDRVPEELLRATEERARAVRGLESLKFLWEDFLLPLARAMRGQVEEILAALRPDILVVDQQAIGGALAARRLGLPFATFATTSASVIDPFGDLPKIREWRDTMLSDLERESGLPVTGQPDLSHELVVVFSTLELVGAGRSFDQRFAFVGPALQGRPQDVPFPWDALEPVPRILLSLGTVNAERGARFYRVAADALGDGPIQVVIVAPEALAGTLPGNFLRRDYVPQLALMPHVDAVICHGGHNTTCEALFHGKPLVIAPIKDDQPVVADQVVGAGAGVRVKFGRVNAAGLRDAVRVILEEPSYAAAAARVGASFRAAGGAERAAQVLERLAR